MTLWAMEILAANRAKSAMGKRLGDTHEKITMNRPLSARESGWREYSQWRLTCGALYS